MKVFLNTVSGGNVLVRMRAEGEGVVGDAMFTIEPTDVFFGWTGKELTELGEGEHDLQPKTKRDEA